MSLESSSENENGYKEKNRISTEGPRETHSNWFFLDYESLVWFVYGVINILAILDRFFWNVWPRETYNIGAGSAGSDFKDGLKAGPWSVQVYDIIARASGRFTIIALNLMLFTMMHSLMSFLAESWIARHIIDFSNFKVGNRRLHIWNGVGIVVFTLAHVWTIILPCVTDGWKAEVVLGNFEWPLSERAPKGFKDANVETKTMSLQGDDVYRIIEMTILLAVLLPLSFRWFRTRYHIAIHLHNTIQVLYFIDIVRRHTHPHSWILNTPFFFAWVVDTFIGCYWRRQKPIVTRKIISDDYMLLLWNQKQKLDTVGPKYFFRLCSSSILERAHVFTSFENRLGLDLADGHPWSVCLLIRVYNKPRKVRIPKQDKVSHTKYVQEDPSIDMYTWGPFLGDMCEKVMCNIRADFPSTVIAGGSAAGYMIDSLQQHVSYGSIGQMTLLYTTSDSGVFEWVLAVIREIISKRTAQGGLIKVVMALTNGGVEEDNGKKMKIVDQLKKQTENTNAETEIDSTSESDEALKDVSIVVQFGRLDFEILINNHTTAFFQGSGSLQLAAKNACNRMQDVKFVAGPVYDGEAKQKDSVLSQLRRRFFNGTNNV